jgi:hypothetical protein
MVGNSRCAFISFPHSLPASRKAAHTTGNCYSSEVLSERVLRRKSRRASRQVGPAHNALCSLKTYFTFAFQSYVKNHTSSKVTINHTQSGISLKSFTINKHPKVFKIYNKRIHSHLYSMFTTM